ncbi:actin cytoskeleton-regulatory complex protein PAN1-like [Amphibalanus amphitrite]|uniref:actin cytoskeleton-regulatory complex protein PAN1-like n=1 Tax=Amphibalanus amphitrite TaxID=1232801 RepID=UPI001C90D3DB|nr:actin cytoskeleton-regulatory complex protein PAN1-like [Amphibalanus amphitrite]
MSIQDRLTVVCFSFHDYRAMPKARAPVRGRAVSQPDGAARARRQSTRRQSGASVPAGPRRRAAAPPRGRQQSEPAATQRPAVAGQAVVLDAAQLRAVVADVVRDALQTVGPTAACGSTGLAGCRDAAGPSAQQDTPPTTTRSPSPPPALPPPMAPPPPPLPPPSATPPTGSPPHLPGVPGSAAVGRRGADIMGLGRLRYAADVTALEAAALAPATARAYRGTWDRVRHFIGIGPAIPLFPIPTATVIDFIGACFRAGNEKLAHVLMEMREEHVAFGPPGGQAGPPTIHEEELWVEGVKVAQFERFMSKADQYLTWGAVTAASCGRASVLS